jgi:membrane-bound lytic murein transglycosylase D
VRQSRVSTAILAGLLAGCATAPVAPPAPAATPPPSPPVALPVATFPAAVVSPTPALDPVTLTIERAEAEFENGRAEFERARLVAAREHFDRAIEILLVQPGGARKDPRSTAALDRLLDRIAALDVLALREADGIAESRSAPAAIDEVLNAALFDVPVPKATTAETVEADLQTTPRDIPVVANAKVLGYVELYQGRLHDFMQQALDRGQRYLPMIQAVFREAGLPLDLAYVPLVESAFMPNALSRASARGMWQFMQGTAAENGLKQDWFIDERADPEKATRAAAQYWKTLRDMFDSDWPFALASYNAGPGTLVRAERRSKSADFWVISNSTRYLPRETREYVPMIMAAIIIGKNPELYGFDRTLSAPPAFEKVEIPGALDLKLIAEWANVTVEQLPELNPELRRPTTPMTPHQWRVPIGTATMVQAGLATADSLYRTFAFHTIRKGETLGGIARKYGVSPAAIREANGLSANARLSVRQTLAIPSRSTTALPPATSAKPANGSAGGSASAATAQAVSRAAG